VNPPDTTCHSSSTVTSMVASVFISIFPMTVALLLLDYWVQTT
jgi:hypothetical protein